MSTALKDRSLDTFAAVIMTRTMQSKIDQKFYAVIDTGFGHYGSFPDFAWSGDTEEEAIAGCGRSINRRAAKDATLGFGVDGFERLKTIWEEKEKLVAYGINLKEFDRSVRDTAETFHWGLASYDPISGDFYKRAEGLKLEGMLQVGLAGLKNWSELGCDFVRIEEEAVALRKAIADSTRDFKCECTEETFAILDRRINDHMTALSPTPPSL
jgi:hypothetical protein